MNVLKPKCLHQTWAQVRGNKMIKYHNGCAYSRWKKWQHDITCSRCDKWKKQQWWLENNDVNGEQSQAKMATCHFGTSMSLLDLGYGVAKQANNEDDLIAFLHNMFWMKINKNLFDKFNKMVVALHFCSI